MANCNLQISNDKNPFCIHYIESEKFSANVRECGFCKQPTEFRCRVELDNRLPRMSQSSRIDFLSCRMKYFYNHIVGIKLKKEKQPEAVKASAIWDKFIELRYSGHNNIKEEVYKLFELYDVSWVTQCKLTALIKAFYTIGINVDISEFKHAQHEFNYKIEDVSNRMIVNGKIDLSYHNHFKKIKLTGSPDFYTNIHGIENQCSTYFLSNPDYEYCDMMITRFPKQLTNNRKDETLEQFKSRVYSDIISRPGHYFIKYDRKNNTYGVRFWRSEFDLELTKRIDSILSDELRICIDNDAWFKNKLACCTPAPCQYLHICDNGVISEMMYEDKEKK